MNIVLADCEEFRRVKAKGEVKAGQNEQEDKRYFSLSLFSFFPPLQLGSVETCVHCEDGGSIDRMNE